MKLNLLKNNVCLFGPIAICQEGGFCPMADPVTELLPHFFGGGGFCSAAVPVLKLGSPFWQKAIILLRIPGDYFS